MEYDLLYGTRSLRDLKHLDKTLSKRIVDRIEKMKHNLSGDIKKLTDHSPQYRLRVSDFRVLFDIEDDCIIIQRVYNRRDAY